MDSVLVVQMARMGDFMQTTPLLRGFQNDRRVAVLVDNRVADIAQKSSCADDVIGVDMGHIFSIIDSHSSADKQFDEMKSYFGELNNMIFDRVINVNHSSLSALLSLIPKSRQITGYRLKGGFCDIEPDKWFLFLNKMVKYRPLSPFNIADAFYYSAHTADTHPLHLGYELAGKERQKASAIFSELGIKEGDRVVAFQIGTNSPGRQWLAEYFAELALMIMQSKTHVILLGSSNDIGISETIRKIVEHHNPQLSAMLKNLVGRTVVTDIAPVLSKCKTLVSGDTGPMHIAAAVGCRVVALFLGPANLFETGPYGEGHFVLQPDITCCPCTDSDQCTYDFACSRKISPEKVFAVVKSIIYDEEFAYPSNGDIRFYKSEIDKWGVVYRSFLKEPLSEIDVQNLCYREMGKTIVDPEHELSTDRFECSVKDNIFLEDEKERLKRLILMFYNDPVSVQSALLDTSFTFWHPWIEWFAAAVKNNGSGSGEIFARGLYNGLKVLSKLGE